MRRKAESPMESGKIQAAVTPLKPISGGLSMLFPELDWNLKKAGYKTDPIIFISIALATGLSAGAFMFAMMSLLIMNGKMDAALGSISAVLISVLAFFYVMLLPNLKIMRNRAGIDKNLEYMLKDMQIQLTAGIPLFDIFVNVAAGSYGECSVVCSRVVRDVQSGKSIVNVLDEHGLISPSEYMRRVFWQIVNALKTGSNVGLALKMISAEIRTEKENKITIYSHELGLFSLVYMIFVIVLPSMGITLLLILSSFLGGAQIDQSIFWGLLIAVTFFQIVFITFIRNKRPDIS